MRAIALFEIKPYSNRKGTPNSQRLSRARLEQDVQDGGNQMNHGVWTGGATVETEKGEVFRVRSLDAVNMCPMTKEFPFGTPLPAGSNGLKRLGAGSVFGIGSNLYNNLWNTNYPLYYPYYDPAYCTSPTECKNANAKFRFVLEI